MLRCRRNADCFIDIEILIIFDDIAEIIIPGDMCRNLFFLIGILRFQLYNVFFCCCAVRIVVVHNLCIRCSDDECIAREYSDVCILISGSIPFLNYPVAEDKVRIC